VRVLHVRNVHRAIPAALAHLVEHGERRESRNGPVLQPPHPVTTVYSHPLERVEAWVARNSNPYLHLFESAWMLAGRNDVASLVRYAKRFAEFSDDGETFNAPYGYRWRHATTQNVDQLAVIADQLRANPNTRQAVLQIWTVKHDLLAVTKDHACNLTATFQVGSDGRLHMCVFCRSNDIVWGCYGANAVHFSYLLEYVAARAGIPVGTYTQISVNWHGYLSTVQPLVAAGLHQHGEHPSSYETGAWTPYPITRGGFDAHWFDVDLAVATSDQGRAVEASYHHAWFREVLLPVMRSHDAYKAGDRFGALHHISDCAATDWQQACRWWLARKAK